MSNQSAINRTKSTKETQEQAVKQAQSQQYRHQSDILDITLLPPQSTRTYFTPRCSLHISTLSRQMPI